jgi:O-antigen/teichoic acid export membrane protein
MSDQHQSSYRQIVKATSIFGGVQLFNIAVTIFRSKLVAVLLGAQGMGISALLVSVTTLVSAITNLGINISAVKNVAEANANNDEQRIGIVTAVLRRLIWSTSVVAALFMLIGANWLSETTFGNDDFSTAFRWLSISLLMANLSSGELVLLQGLRHLNYLAKANILGSSLGLVVSVPFYVKWGIDGIVPAMIASSAVALCIAVYFALKVRSKRLAVNLATVVAEGKSMIRMGFFLSVSTLVATGASYLLRIYISNSGGIEEVGLYGAGFAIINTYVGMVFTAMSTDYYPRLSSLASVPEKANELVNHQIEIALLILGPLLVIFLVFVKYAIILLYSREFIPSVSMVEWMVLAIYLKAVTWGMGFLLLAKGESQLFFYSELFANIYTLVLNILGYNLYGIPGLGISYLIAYGLSVIQNFMLIHLRYKFRFSIELFRILSFNIVTACACFILLRNVEQPNAMVLSTPLILITIVFSYWQINKRIDIAAVVKQMLGKIMS